MLGNLKTSNSLNHFLSYSNQITLELKLHSPPGPHMTVYIHHEWRGYNRRQWSDWFASASAHVRWRVFRSTVTQPAQMRVGTTTFILSSKRGCDVVSQLIPPQRRWMWSRLRRIKSGGKNTKHQHQSVLVDRPSCQLAVALQTQIRRAKLRVRETPDDLRLQKNVLSVSQVRRENQLCITRPTRTRSSCLTTLHHRKKNGRWTKSVT